MSGMSPERLRHVIEAALLTAGRPLSLDVLAGLFQSSGAAQEPGEVPSDVFVRFDSASATPSRDEIRAALDALGEDYRGRGIELKEVASGFRVQVRPDYAEALRPLWSERPARYSRALLETLALIAYRQPITRGEIEDIRGVSVSSSIVKTLLEREWVRVVGHRDVPGKPAMYGTTRQFLDYFNLKSLAELPTLAEIRDIDEISGELFPDEVTPQAPAEPEGTGEGAGPAAGNAGASELSPPPGTEPGEANESVAEEGALPVARIVAPEP